MIWTDQSTMPVVIVTGAAGGMGSEIVADLSRDHLVVALGRSEAALSRFDSNQNVRPCILELRDLGSFAKVIESIDRIDGLVHVAAISDRFSVEESTVDEWQRHFEVNVIAPAELTRLALPALRRSRGQVIFINSGAGERAVPGHTVYSATKFALRALADGLRAEEAAAGVRVSTVSPGPTDTGMSRADHARYGEPGSPYTADGLIAPSSVAKAVRLVMDSTDDCQITQVSVRPRVELSR